MPQNCPFRIPFHFQHNLCVETCIHPSYTTYKNCLYNSFLKQLYTVTPQFTYRLPFYPHWCFVSSDYTLSLQLQHALYHIHPLNVHNYSPPFSVVTTQHYNFLIPPLYQKIPFSNFQPFVNTLALQLILLHTGSAKGNRVRYPHTQFSQKFVIFPVLSVVCLFCKNFHSFHISATFLHNRFLLASLQSSSVTLEVPGRLPKCSSQS